MRAGCWTSSRDALRVLGPIIILGLLMWSLIYRMVYDLA